MQQLCSVITDRVSPEAVCCACGALCSMSASLPPECSQLNIVEPLVGAMRSFSKIANVYAHACNALANACVANPETKKKAVNDGAVQQAVRALHDHPASPAAAAAGCRLIAALACGSPQNREAIRAQSGVAEVVQSEWRHRDDSNVVARACEALRNLTVSPQCAKELVDQGGVLKVVEAISHHEQPVVDTACYVLLNLTDNTEAVRQLQGSGILSSLADKSPGCPSAAKLISLLQSQPRPI
eukprot:TRINITY_DN1701_c0_g1_i1.p2 TRINITY_DN1701_c0_g1~~TRINITY_DN1701_c0_g1_i1.p2  ORF type:complete len:241 (-),score=64.94 TRINITY_DN1701_c0_g1_i1:66-788(-)